MPFRRARARWMWMLSGWWNSAALPPKPSCRPSTSASAEAWPRGLAGGEQLALPLRAHDRRVVTEEIAQPAQPPLVLARDAFAASASRPFRRDRARGQGCLGVDGLGIVRLHRILTLRFYALRRCDGSSRVLSLSTGSPGAEGVAAGLCTAEGAVRARGARIRRRGCRPRLAAPLLPPYPACPNCPRDCPPLQGRGPARNRRPCAPRAGSGPGPRETPSTPA